MSEYCPACGHMRRTAPTRFDLRRMFHLQPRPAQCAHMESDEAGQTAKCWCRDLSHGS